MGSLLLDLKSLYREQTDNARYEHKHATHKSYDTKDESHNRALIKES